MSRASAASLNGGGRRGLSSVNAQWQTLKYSIKRSARSDSIKDNEKMNIHIYIKKMNNGAEGDPKKERRSEKKGEEEFKK